MKLGDRDFGVAKSIVATRRSIVLIVKASNYRRNSGNRFQGEALTHVQYSRMEEDYAYGKFKGHFSLQYSTISPHKCMYEETISGLNPRKLTCFN